LLSPSTLGLPKVLEVDCSKHELKQAVEAFRHLAGADLLVAKNTRLDKTIESIRGNAYANYEYSYSEKDGTSIISKQRYTNYEGWSGTTDVKRVLPLEKVMTELGEETLFVNRVKMLKDAWKGISEKQFKKEFLQKDYRYFVLDTCNDSASWLMLNHFVVLGYHYISTILMPNLDPENKRYENGSYLKLYAKDFNLVKRRVA